MTKHRSVFCATCSPALLLAIGLGIDDITSVVNGCTVRTITCTKEPTDYSANIMVISCTFYLDFSADRVKECAETHFQYTCVFWCDLGRFTIYSRQMLCTCGRLCLEYRGEICTQDLIQTKLRNAINI